jgi:tetratricopeptide (TPR) repeat protein
MYYSHAMGNSHMPRLHASASLPCSAGARALVWLCAAACVLCACKDREPRRPAEKSLVAPIEGDGDGDAGATARSSLPTESSLPRTTEPELAVRNLEQRIANLERVVREHPSRIAVTGNLVPLLAVRASVLGDIEDYQRALDLAEAYVVARPADARAYLVRAQAAALVHRFSVALSDIEQAGRLGADAAQSQELVASIAEATGDLERALALRQASADKRPTLQSLGALAAVHAQLGRREQAEAGFRQALDANRDADPFALAWLCFQWGRLYEEAGEPSSARALYEIAYARLPQHQQVVGHLAGALAGTGDTERAIAVLQRAIERSPHPEHLGQLAEFESARGRLSEAASLHERAKAGFDRLLERFPEAYADHAARYFLGAGSDPARAYALARANLDIRKTSAAYTLAVEAALAAGAPENACTHARAGSVSPHASRRLLFHAWRAFAACNDESHKADLARRLGIAP